MWAQGVRVGLYFYLKPADQALLAFHDFNDQLPPLLHELHQPTAWQEPGPEPSVTPDTVRHLGQRYLRFRLAENLYYPLTTEPLRFPPLALTMVKFKVLKKPEPGQENRLAGYKTYYFGRSGGAGAAPAGSPGRRPRGGGQLPAAGGHQPDALSGGRVVYLHVWGGGAGQFVGRAGAAAGGTARPGCVWPRGARGARARWAGASCFGTAWWPGGPARCPSIACCSWWFSTPPLARYDTLRPDIRPEVRGRATAPEPLPKPDDDPFYGPALAGADATMQSLDVYHEVQRYADWLLLALATVAGFGWWRAGRRG